MSFKSKDLHYEKQEPAFLRKLRGDIGGGIDRHDVSIARPRKPRLDTGDDDGPTIVDEEGESMTKEQYDALVDGHQDKASEVVTELDSDSAKSQVNHAEDEKAQQQKLANIGTSNKRKQARVIRDDGGDDNQNATSKNDKESSTVEGTKPKPSSKGKKKKIKLSFDDDAV